MFRNLSVLGWLFLAACRPAAVPPTAGPTQTLLPLPVAGRTPTLSPAATVRPVETEGPSPTPFSHRIVEGDTLLGIALQYGVEVNDLLLANPGVNPRFLSVGDDLIVPLEAGPGPVPTATPRPVELSSAACYPAPSGEVWCLMTARLPAPPAVEGLVGLVTLIGPDGEAIRSEPAFSPLSLLIEGSELPLVAYFSPPVPEFGTATVSLLSAVSAGDRAARYPPVELLEVQTRIDPSRRSAEVEGVLRLASAGQSDPVWLRAVALARGPEGQPVGLATFVPDPDADLEGGILFRMLVSSLGPPIARVEVLAEARLAGP